MVDTDPHELAPESLPPRTKDDTGPIRDAADVRLYLEIDGMQARLGEIARYLRGRIEGHEVELAQSRAFESRTAKAFERLEENQRIMIKALEDLTNGLLTESSKVVVLQERARQVALKRCEGCPVRELDAL